MPFTPFQPLADTLLAHIPEDHNDGSHDVSHIHRVWKNAYAIQREEGGCLEMLLAATILHDCVPVEKNSPLRSQASRLSAEKASMVLAALGWSAENVRRVAHAIETHSFSANIPPTTLEAKILQDADRLDAIGMVGVARCFYTAGRMGSGLYDYTDPTASSREYQDKRFAIDHFHTKLLKLASDFQTHTGARLATERHQRLQRFLDEFMDEVGVEAEQVWSEI
ncbi:MAG: phosphohydrolase [Pseudomonas sp.]|nr:phosphohydrolase [Pseudomonas sp.]